MMEKLTTPFLATIEAFVGLTAVAGGVALLVGWIKFPIELLYGSPLTSYDIPGVVLMVVVGGSALVAAVAVARHYRWAPELSILAGLASVGWITVQVAIVGLLAPGLQALYFVLGLSMIGLAAGIWSAE